MGTKSPFNQTGHPVQMCQSQGIRGDPLSVGFAIHTQRGYSKGMPQSSHLGLGACLTSCVTGYFGLPWLLRQGNSSESATFALPSMQPKTPREEIRVEEPHWNIGSCL